MLIIKFYKKTIFKKIISSHPRKLVMPNKSINQVNPLWRNQVIQIRGRQKPGVRADSLNRKQLTEVRSYPHASPCAQVDTVLSEQFGKCNERF